VGNAQGEDTLALRLKRDFGYSSGSGKIQGAFTMQATGAPEIIKVKFFIDEHNLGEDSESPFAIRFSTDSYDKGTHRLYATGEKADGSQVGSNEILVEFVSAEEGWQAGVRIALPIVAIAFGMVFLSFVFSFTTGRKLRSLPPGTPRKYGFKGGSICPLCGRPFSLGFLSFNFVSNVLDRCPYCGKWSFLRPVPLDRLRAAELAELEGASTEGKEPALSEAESLQRELDQSRFQDL
jgi:hypothetical protein